MAPYASTHPALERAREARRQSLLQRMETRERRDLARDQRAAGVPVATLALEPAGTARIARVNTAFAELTRDGRLGDTVLRAAEQLRDGRSPHVVDPALRPLCLVPVRPDEVLVTVVTDVTRRPLARRSAGARIDAALRDGRHVVAGLVELGPVDGRTWTAGVPAPEAWRLALAVLAPGDLVGRYDPRRLFVATVNADRWTAGDRFDRLVECLGADATRPTVVTCAEARPGEDAVRLLGRLESHAAQRRAEA